MSDNENLKEIYESEVEDFDLKSYPFDPEDISIDKKPMVMDAIIRRFKQGTIIMHPDFQREEVWSRETKSRLIESLLLRIPITMFYVSADEEGKLTVVDGLQRLSAIRDFVLKEDYKPTNAKALGDGMRLQGLEFLTDYEGKTFNELPISMQNRINETEFTFTIINPGTPDEVKRNIFKRINTGGEGLKPQEIRNALYAGKSTELLRILATSPAFTKATTSSVRSNRMESYEVVLRGIAFMLRDADSYPKNGNMDKFLGDTMVILNSYPDFSDREILRLEKMEGLDLNSVKKDRIEKIEEIFKLAMKRAKTLFGTHAFRKSYGTKRRTPINKALFELWCSILAVMDENDFNKIRYSSQFMTDYNALLDDDKFNVYISRDSWKPTSVRNRYVIINDMIKKYTL
jgi:CO dehydrogenase/acetyl-CoA synthase epsilon subunit